MWEFIELAFPYALIFTAPILVAALGGLLSERSGVVNIGLEGLMIVGTFAAAFVTSSFYESMGNGAIWLGLLSGAIAGGLFSLLHAYASINLKANQIISGIAINMMAVALTTFLARDITGSGTIKVVKGFTRQAVPGLSEIPVVGQLFFQKSYITTYIVLAITLLVWFFVNKTIKGTQLKACGENPQAAESVGINVIRVRYFGVVASGVLAGLGGALIVLTYHSEFNGSVAGLGYLALATLIFGKWDPVKVLGAAFFFGFARTLATMSSVNEVLKQLSLPMQFYNALPYVITLIALAMFSKNAVGPKAAGEPYEPGKR